MVVTAGSGTNPGGAAEQSFIKAYYRDILIAILFLLLIAQSVYFHHRLV